MNKPRVVLPGILIGLIGLGLAVVLGVVLPKANGDYGDLTLPDTLPGGYVAADTRAAYEGLTSATDEQKASFATQQVNAEKFAAESYKKVGTAGVARNYLTKDGQGFIAVQLIRAEGGALSPYLFSDPGAAEAGSNAEHLIQVGDAICIESGAADGNGGVQQSMIQCQKSEHGLTLQLTTQGSAEKVATLINEVWHKVA